MAGAALVLSGCGGVLGTAVSPAIDQLVPVKCAIDNAVAENGNYSNAVFDVTSALPFVGSPQNDLLKPANRMRIFAQRKAELRREAPVVAGIETKDDLDRRFVAAAKQDLAQANALMVFDGKYTPGDPKTPLTQLPIPEALDNLIAGTTGEVKKRFDQCTTPADLARRTKEYGG